jgi:hypothetical protein
MLPKTVIKKGLRLLSSTRLRKELITTKEIETALLGKLTGFEKENIAQKLDINNDGAVQTKELGATIEGIFVKELCHLILSFQAQFWTWKSSLQKPSTTSLSTFQLEISRSL